MLRRTLKETSLFAASILLISLFVILSSEAAFAANDGDPGVTEGQDGTPQAEEEIPDGWQDIDGGRKYYQNGKALKGLKEIEGALYYFSRQGFMQTGFQVIRGNTYYFNEKNGIAVSGIKKIRGAKYYFDKDTSVMQTGLVSYKGKKYYFGNSGKMSKGKKKINGYYYFFSKKNGAMKKGWVKIGKNRYYFGNKGRMLIGKKTVGGKTRYFNYKGIYKPNLSKNARKIWKSTSDTAYYVCISKGSRKVYVLKGRKYGWKLKKKFSCSIGTSGTPTPTGRFKINGKVLHFGENKGYTCWYASAFIGRLYLMHSVVCYQGTKIPSDGRLGMAISHGCVRMSIGSAKWIYDNVPVGTPVYIY